MSELNSYNNWKGLTQEQKDYAIYDFFKDMQTGIKDIQDSLNKLDCRLKKLEGKSLYYKSAAFLGGIFGGAVAMLMQLLSK